MTDDHVHEHDLGLSHDLPTLLNRRRLLGFLGGAGVLALAGCGAGSSATPSASASASASTSATTTEIPEATSGSDKLRTSQLALPEDTSNLVYATDGYQASVRNMQGISLATDNVLRDGWSRQLATVTGDVDSGFTATLNVPV